MCTARMSARSVAALTRDGTLETLAKVLKSLTREQPGRVERLSPGLYTVMPSPLTGGGKAIVQDTACDCTLLGRLGKGARGKSPQY